MLAEALNIYMANMNFDMPVYIIAGGQCYTCRYSLSGVKTCVTYAFYADDFKLHGV